MKPWEGEGEKEEGRREGGIPSEFLSFVALGWCDWFTDNVEL